jgi:hypothetical protein
MEPGGQVETSRQVDANIDFLVRLFLLPPRAKSVLWALAKGGTPMTTRAMAERLAVDESLVAAELAAEAPLVEWGLVRRLRPSVSDTAATVAINPRIARFLVGT